MWIIIRYQNGLRTEGVLLAAGSERMRVAIKSQRDAVELHRGDAGWRTVRGADIEIEALVPIPGTELSLLCPAVHPRRNAELEGPRKPPAYAVRANC